MLDLAVICVDCGTEFTEIDGWVDRCASCAMVLEDHDGGLHVAVVTTCVRCDATDDAALAPLTTTAA